MKSHIVASASFPLVLALLAACGSAPPPPPATPADQGTPPVGADAPAGTQYASGDVPVGDDADSYQDSDPSALQDFHPALDGSGSWQDDPTYGTVWVPSQDTVGPDFVPYQTAGHWTYDNDDYVWVSDYDWGWAPFHYGRWVPRDEGGWAWIPGRTYRGAWVTWGADDGYGTVGWYPMGPEFVWRGGAPVAYTYNVAPRWAFVGRGDVFAANLRGHFVVGSAAAGLTARVHPFSVGASGHVSGGPAPSKLGFSASQIPHATGAASASLAKAATFSKPSTAVAAGGHPATHVSSNATAGLGAQAHGSAGATGAAGGATPLNGAHTNNTPTTGSAPATGNAGSTGHMSGTTMNPVHSNTPATATASGGTSGGGHTTSVNADHSNSTPHNSAPSNQPQQQPKRKPPQGSGNAQPHSGGGGSHGGGGKKK